jgi:DNA-directed RNA polymerase subunit E'/Rpb7
MFGVIEKDCAVLVPLDSWSKELEREKAVLSAIKKSQIGLVMPNYGLVVSCYEVGKKNQFLLFFFFFFFFFFPGS